MNGGYTYKVLILLIFMVYRVYFLTLEIIAGFMILPQWPNSSDANFFGIIYLGHSMNLYRKRTERTDDMLIVISPAKTLDYDSPLSFKKSTFTHFHSYSDKLIEILKKKSASQISRLMNFSDNHGELNYRRYHSWSPKSGS